MSTIVILLASGIGKRFGDKIPKQFYKIKDKPLLYYSLNTLYQIDEISRIILVANPIYIEETKNIVKNFINKTDVISGGKERNFSIENAFNYIKNKYKSKYVIIHDHNRPLINKYDFLQLINTTKITQFTAFKLPLTYCIGSVDANSFLLESPHRNKYIETHNPCCMTYELFIKMYTKLNLNERNTLYSDHILFAKKLGIKPKLILGNRLRLTKVTYKYDIDTIINYI